MGNFLFYFLGAVSARARRSTLNSQPHHRWDFHRRQDSIFNPALPSIRPPPSSWYQAKQKMPPHYLLLPRGTGARISAASDAASSGLGLGEIIGIPLGILVAVLLGILVYALCKEKDKEKDKEEADYDVECLVKEPDDRSLREVMEEMEERERGKERGRERGREREKERRRDERGREERIVPPWEVPPLSPLPRAVVVGRD